MFLLLALSFSFSLTLSCLQYWVFLSFFFYCISYFTILLDYFFQFVHAACFEFFSIGLNTAWAHWINIWNKKWWTNASCMLIQHIELTLTLCLEELESGITFEFMSILLVLFFVFTQMVAQLNHFSFVCYGKSHLTIFVGVTATWTFYIFVPYKIINIHGPNKT